MFDATGGYCDFRVISHGILHDITGKFVLTSGFFECGNRNPTIWFHDFSFYCSFILVPRLTGGNSPELLLFCRRLCSTHFKTIDLPVNSRWDICQDIPSNEYHGTVMWFLRIAPNRSLHSPPHRL